MQCELGGRLRRGPGRADPRHCKLAIGIWNVTSLKEPELVCEVKRYQLNIVGSAPHTALTLEPNSWRGAGLSHTLELPMERGVGQVLG